MCAAPYALAPDSSTRHAREQRWREEEIINLVGLGTIPVGPWTPVTLKLWMDKNVLNIRPFREQGAAAGHCPVFLKVPDNGEQVDPLRPA